MPEGTKIQILSPLVRGRKGEYRELLKRAQADGFIRARIDGVIRGLEEDISLDKKLKHNIEILIDRLVVSDKIRTRLTDS